MSVRMKAKHSTDAFITSSGSTCSNISMEALVVVEVQTCAKPNAKKCTFLAMLNGSAPKSDLVLHWFMLPPSRKFCDHRLISLDVNVLTNTNTQTSSEEEPIKLQDVEDDRVT